MFKHAHTHTHTRTHTNTQMQTIYQYLSFTVINRSLFYPRDLFMSNRHATLTTCDLYLEYGDI